MLSHAKMKIENHVRTVRAEDNRMEEMRLKDLKELSTRTNRA